MQKFTDVLVFLAVILFCSCLIGISAEGQTIHSDEGPVSTNVTERRGEPVIGIGDGNNWQVLHTDSSGNLYVTEALYEVAGCDTETVTTSWDKLEFPKNYEKFIIYCDDVAPFWVAFGTTTYAHRVRAGAIYTYSGQTTKVYRKMESGTGKITVNYYNRKRHER